MIFHEKTLMKYLSLFFSEYQKNVAKFVVSCSRDWGFGLEKQFLAVLSGRLRQVSLYMNVLFLVLPILYPENIVYTMQHIIYSNTLQKYFENGSKHFDC